MALADPDMAAVEDGASTATLQEMVDDADQLESGEDALAFELGRVLLTNVTRTKSEAQRLCVDYARSRLWPIGTCLRTSRVAV